MDLVEAKGKTIISRHPWEQARLFVIKKLIFKNILLQKDSIVLDIGCGDTYVVENLANQFPDVKFYAIDIAFTNELMDEYKRKLSVKNVFLFRALEDVPIIKSEKSSLVLLTDVIEHIQDDIKFMSELTQHETIGHKTIFIITVPAYQSLFCSHDVFLGHYRRYTNKSLRKNLSEAGLHTEKSGYFFSSLLPMRILQVLKEKVNNVKKEQATTGLVQWGKGKTISSLLKVVLLMDFEISFFLKKIGLNIPGLSNYAICKKSV